MLPVPLGCGLVSLPCFLLTSTFTNISARPINGMPTGDNSLTHCATSTTFLLCSSTHERRFQKIQHHYTGLPKKFVTALSQYALSLEVSGNEKYLGSCRQSADVLSLHVLHLPFPSFTLISHFYHVVRSSPSRKDTF